MATNGVPEDVYARLQLREGGHKKVIKDQGGTTKGGIAESGNLYTAEQIKALTPEKIRETYNNYWRTSGAMFRNPATAEIAFDMAVNAGPGKTNRIIQQALNDITPNRPPIPVNGAIGPITKDRLRGVDESELGRRMFKAFGQHHKSLVQANPAKYKNVATGWEARRNLLAQSPSVSQILAGKNLPQVVIGRLPQAAPKPQQPVPVAPALTKRGSVKALLRQARNATHEHPTQAQKSSGNYKKGRLTIHGLQIAIENPVGSYRSGTSQDGKNWKRRLTCDYGYFCGSKAVDGDAVDVFIGPDLDSEFVVAIDQMIDGKYDETKFVMCVKTQELGEKLYLSNYEKGWKLGPVSTTTVGQLKTWLKDGNTKKPFKGQMVKAATRLSDDTILGLLQKIRPVVQK